MFRLVSVFVLTSLLVAALPHTAAQGGSPPAQTGQIAFVSSRDGAVTLYVMAADGSNLQQVTQTPLAAGEIDWSPDGTQLVFAAAVTPNQTELAVADVTTGTTQTITHLGAQVSHPVWSPDGTQIAFAANPAQNNDLYIVAPDGSGLADLTNSPADDQWPTWSPDSAQIAFQSDRNGDVELYVMTLQTKAVTRLFNSPGVDRNPIWSPDGMRIVFISERNQNADIFVIDAIGTNLVQLSNTPYDDATPAWSPDGVWIAYSGGVGPGVSELFTINADGYAQQQLTNGGAQVLDPDWSPDGAWIAYASNRSGSFDIYALPAAGGESLNLTNMLQSNETFPLWAGAASGSSALPPPPIATPGGSEIQGGALPPPPTATLYIPPPPTATPTLPLPSPTMTPTMTPTLIKADLLLVYNTVLPSFDLINVSGRKLDLTPLSFEGNGRVVDTSVWLKSGGMSSSLSSFAIGGCLGLWGLGVSEQPRPPECTWRHSWWESDNMVFWTGGTFTVRYNGVLIATCVTADGRCSVALSNW